MRLTSLESKPTVCTSFPALPQPHTHSPRCASLAAARMKEIRSRENDSGNRGANKLVEGLVVTTVSTPLPLCLPGLEVTSPHTIVCPQMASSLSPD